MSSCRSEKSRTSDSEHGDLLSADAELQQPDKPVALVHLDSASSREVKVRLRETALCVMTRLSSPLAGLDLR